MNTRIMQIRALDKKTSSLTAARNIVPNGSSWIHTVREAIGMTALQLATRLGVTQPRITKMESNEENLKLSTMKKVAEALDCEFVYYFKPKSTFQDIVQNQAKRKAEEILLDVNINMALENQGIQKAPLKYKPKNIITLGNPDPSLIVPCNIYLVLHAFIS